MNSFDKLKTKLAELFQLDQADLDFGIYRVMNARRDEITRFLERDLLPQVREAFGEYKSSDKAEIQKELDKVAHDVKAAGMDPEQAPKVKELRARLAEEAVDVTALENEVYDHLCSFFSRYYDEGDFISLRRYKEGVYAIPYEGEEVKLHWANHDQYYIKTTEYFRDYAFKTPSGHRVHFKIAEADTEKDNIKAANGNDRRFLLHGDKPVIEENGELIIRFEYRPDGEKRKQDAINADTARCVIEDLNTEKFMVWQQRLSAKWKRAGGKETDKTILDKHLFDYTRRNTFDYFIHKDLEGFLRRELDFYIKNEVMRLDDIEEESAPRVEQYLSKIKVIRRIAHKIIDFLAQIENFQKKLWLKKKFVVKTNYCVTLDRVPEELYPEIAANEAQREEWVRLFAIDDIGTTKNTNGTKKEKQESLFSVDSGVKYSVPLTVEFLKANDKLVLDTRFFCDEFKEWLVASINNLDDKVGGLLVHSENFQAMQLLLPAFNESLKCIYVDPPYNTGKDEFIYKDSYQHSCWMSFLIDRMALCRQLLKNDGAFFCSIDDNEAQNLEAICNDVFGREQLLAPLFIQVRYANKTLSEDSDFQRTIERVFFYAKDKYAFKPVKNTTEYPLEKFHWKITEKAEGTSFTAGGKQCVMFKSGEYTIEKVEATLEGLKETWATGSLLRQKGSSGEFFGIHLAPRKGVDGLCCLYKVEGIGEDGLGYRYFTGPQRESATKGKFYSGIPLQTLEKVKSGNATKEVPIHNFFDFAGDFGNCRHEGHVDIRGGKKPEKLLHKLISFSSKENANDTVFDPFCGSGTTPSVAHKLGKKYLAVEQGEYFDSKVLVRMKYTLYGSSGGVEEMPSGMFKYIRLESYEDALANIELQRTGPQQRALFPNQETSALSASSAVKSFRESYMLKYMLDVESRGSQTLLNIDNFDDPWNYKLLVGAGSVGETKPVNADLVETFNWLLGLKVRHIDRISLSAPQSEATRQAGGFQVVEGENPSGEKVLVIWRKVRNLAETDPEKIAAAREKANRDLEAFFRKQQYNTLDSEFDVIYVNGDNNLMNVPLDPDKEGVEPRYKVRLIEEEFKRLMFDVKEI
ncbi:putative methyltransferase [bacterium BMS3Bbin14]|nr:putative methyltransferase [bacterium BMS3Bbin14]